MASENTIDRALKGLGSTLVSAKDLVRRATVDFGHAHEPTHKLRIAVLITAICCGLMVPLLWGGTESPIEHAEKPLQSARVRLFERNEKRDHDVLLIDIDDAALAYGDWPDFSHGSGNSEGVGNDRYAWPWPRSVYNKLIRYCREGGARVIVFDFMFSETGPNTNQPRRGELFTYDKAGDDLFVLEACARDDVALAITSEKSGRKPELRDRLLAKYGLTVGGDPDNYNALLKSEERFGTYNSGAVPFAGLLDGLPDLVAEARTLPDEKKLEYARFYEDEVNSNVDMARVLNLRSLVPVSTRESVHGVGGAGTVNVFPDVDGRVRSFDLSGYVGELRTASLPMEALRLLVLSWARDVSAGKVTSAAFAERFPGLSVDAKGLHIGEKVYALDKNLRDVPLEIEGNTARYMGRAIELSPDGRMSLRYHNFLDYHEMPLYQRDPAAYEKQAGTGQPFAAYPRISAKDVLSDYDARFQNRQAREKDEEISGLKTAIATAKKAGQPVEELEAKLKTAQAQRAILPDEEIRLALSEPGTLFKDKVVFIAGTAAGLYDRHETPLDSATPGTWIVATAFDNLRNADVMHEQPRWTIWALALVFTALAANITLYSSRMRPAILLVGLLSAATLGAAVGLFELQYWFHVTAPLSGLFVGLAGGALAKALTEGRQKAQREAFARQYMGTELVDYVISRPQALKLGGENRHMSIYFSDVAGFTTLTETLGPEHPHRLVELLNIYLERMTDIMLESGGVIDKYIGDAIMCFWGAPREMEDHAVRACKGALACKAEMSRMQPLFADAVRSVAPQLIKPDGSVLAARAGINSGLVTVGNMGSSKRFAYTVMGDAVNLASRLEGQNKEYGSWIMLGENTEKLVRGEFITRRLDLIVVKGKTKPTEVFELLGPKEAPQFILDLVRDFERGVENFRNREFEHALEWFRTSLQNEPDKDIDNPSALYIERCESFLESPPPEDWNGVFVKKTK